jgi:aspartyl-tRNA(Asn)/glutamyl-tRNA(Gln) amidotransferase subunit A
MTPKYTSLDAVQNALRRGEITLRGLVEYYLERIEATRNLNAYVEVFAHEALVQADALDARLRENPDALGRLCGMVISLKDNICYAGHSATAGSKILEGYTALYSATAVARVRAEDAIIIGRTNCDQFGMGSTNENSTYGPVKNGLAPDRVPGGSSGGAAVSVQMDTCLAALGSDTGGSIRQPAAFCGVMGFKPTYGRISRYGLIAYGSSFDQIGAIAHSASDIALLLGVMAGPDGFDSTAEGPAVEKYSENLDFQGVARIAYFPEAIDGEGLEAGVRSTTRQFIERLKTQGHTVEPVSFDLLDYIIPAYYVLTTAEASSNLARFDGVRYGYRSPNAHNLEETYLLSRTEGFSEEVKRRILLGTFVLSSGYYDAYYSKAQQARRLIRDRVLEILNNYDFILMPAAPDVAGRFGEKSGDPVAMYLSDVFTVSANLAGVPAIALPAGAHPENGLPVGVQLMGRPWEEGKMLAFSCSLYP